MKDSWIMFDAAIAAKATRVLVWGPKGLAKSRHALEALHQSNKRVSQITLNDDIAAQELMGHYVPKGTKFEWHDGPITEAYREGFGLVVNEISRASGAVQDLFLGVLDDPAVSMMTLPTGESVSPGKGFRCIATANHDPGQMDEAIVDRFDAIIHVTTPHPSLVSFLNTKRENLGKIIADSYKDAVHAISPRRALAFLTFSENGAEEDMALALAFGAAAKDIKVALKAVR